MAGQQDNQHTNSEHNEKHGDTERSSKAERESRTEKARQNTNASSATEHGIPAIRHVGPTLESDPEYLSMVGSGGPTPEAQIAADALTEEPGVMITEDTDPLSGRQAAPGRPEPLKTRLPGDTSSDPHTDLGPDNATTVQHRGEAKNAA